MSSIDLVIIGLIHEQPRGAYDIQKEIEYRNIAKWVKISKQSIYSKVLQLEKKQLITAALERDGKRPEKTIYSITEAGKHYFLDLMDRVVEKPVTIFLDFNAVIMNLSFLPAAERTPYIEKIAENIAELKLEIERNLEQKDAIPPLGKSILMQQLTLATSLEQWVNEYLKDS